MNVRIQEAPFEVAREISLLTDGRTDIGGIGCFIGTVRQGARRIAALTLEHYAAMTQPALETIVREAEARWPLLGCTVIHRVGRLLPGEGIVLVLAVSAHRQAALEATQFLIDYLKTRAPFWKKESFEDGEEAWVEARAADDAAAGQWAIRGREPSKSPKPD